MKKDRKRRPWRALLRGFGKTLAGLLALCVGCAAITGAIFMGNLLTDALRDREGAYEEAKEELADLGRGAVNAFKEPSVTAEQQRAYIREQLTALADAQAAVEAQMLAELDGGGYTLEDPFVLVDPYGISPLSAAMLFETEEPARISIHIAGDTPKAEVDFDFSEYGTRHMIPVYGLYANRENAVTVTATARDGSARSAEIAVQTDVLPAALNGFTVRATALDVAAVQPGFNFTYQSDRGACRSAIDINGDFRWYLDTAQGGGLLSFTGYCGDYNGGNSVFISCGSKQYGPVAILELNFLGKLLNAWYAPYGAHHDIEPDATGVLVTGSTSLDSCEDMVYHFDAQSGEIDRVIDYGNCLQPLRDQTAEWGESEYYTTRDWMHLNTVVERDGDLIASARNQSTVVCSDWDGNVKWMLGDPKGYYESLRQRVLTPVGENFTYFYVQHAPELLPDQDGNPDTLDILLFDNGHPAPESGQRRSRLIQYRIDEAAMTAEVVWIWGDDRPELSSAIHGDADLLANGNRLGSFEPSVYVGRRHAYTVELAQDGSVVWEMVRENKDRNMPVWEYRVDRLDIYAESANDLRLGEPAKLFLPGEEGESE